MFESDDFDQVLSQLDFPETVSKNHVNTELPKNTNDSIVTTMVQVNKSNEKNSEFETLKCNTTNNCSNTPQASNKKRLVNINGTKDSIVSPKHTKRKIINSHFDHKTKRKFPGPAGLLTGTLEENKDETIGQMELLSQDIECSQSIIQRDLFESPLWLRLLEDVKVWNLCDIDPVKSIKQQALAGNLRRRKAQTVVAFVETVDRSVIDPLLTLRDSTGHIKCTLHRDAWSTFSPYIVSEYCALVLWKPTVLTTGGAFKKHYLNITLSNIYAIYSSAVLKDEEKQLTGGYAWIYEEDFTVIKSERSMIDIGSNIVDSNEKIETDNSNLLDDLDSIFSDELF